MGNPSQNYISSPAIWDHTMLSTCHPTQEIAPHHNSRRTTRYLIYLRRSNGRLSCWHRRWLYAEMVYLCLDRHSTVKVNDLIATDWKTGSQTYDFVMSSPTTQPLHSCSTFSRSVVCALCRLSVAWHAHALWLHRLTDLECYLRDEISPTLPSNLRPADI